MSFAHRSQRRRAFSLLELVFSLLITLLIGLGMVGAVIYTRQSMELDKQRLSALNYCRQTMEAAQTNASINTDYRKLVEFNAPAQDILATIHVHFHPLDVNGIAQWDTVLTAAPGDQPVLCQVTVSWRPSGRWDRPQSLTMTSIIRAGVK